MTNTRQQQKQHEWAHASTIYVCIANRLCSQTCSIEVFPLSLGGFFPVTTTTIEEIWEKINNSMLCACRMAKNIKNILETIVVDVWLAFQSNDKARMEKSKKGEKQKINKHCEKLWKSAQAVNWWPKVREENFQTNHQLLLTTTHRCGSSVETWFWCFVTNSPASVNQDNNFFCYFFNNFELLGFHLNLSGWAVSFDVASISKKKQWSKRD